MSGAVAATAGALPSSRVSGQCTHPSRCAHWLLPVSISRKLSSAGGLPHLEGAWGLRLEPEVADTRSLTDTGGRNLRLELATMRHEVMALEPFPLPHPASSFLVGLP